MQRPLELCSWKDREALTPVGKEYQQGYKRVNDRLPKREFEFNPETQMYPGTRQIVSAASEVRDKDGLLVTGTWPVAPRKPPQAPRSSQAATQPAASGPGPSTAKRSKRTKTTARLNAHRVMVKMKQKGSDKHKKGTPKKLKGPPLPLDSEDLVMLRQLKDFCKFYANPNFLPTVYNQLQRRLVRPKQRRHPMLIPVFEDPSNQALLASCRSWAASTCGVVNGMKWVSRQHYHQERGVAVFLGAGCFSRGGWKSKAVREGFHKVVEQPSRPSTDPRPDRLVIVDEFRTSRVSSSVHARQPCELHLPDDRPRPKDWVPPAGQVNQRLAPSWGRWLDRDTNACFTFQRIGESKQRPLELCSWKDREALPPVGKEYQQGYKRVNDRLPKDRQRLHRAAEYRRGIDGRARNNA
ncbi:hypothetical protein QJQ45_010312 [Haematococcus lacustris]|nr:hypothetical protein QJQ45_010312 [Haematococcus lacustris]